MPQKKNVAKTIKKWLKNSVSHEPQGLRGKWETGTTKLGARAECDRTVCTQLQCIMSNNVVVVSKSDAGVDMKGLGFKL